MAYQRPMVTVDQNITIAPTSIEREQPAFIFGPNYELHRYSNAEEKPKTAIGTFKGATMQVAYPGAINDEAVDRKHDYTKLTGDNVVVKLADLGEVELPERNVAKALRDENGGYTKLLFAGKAYIDYSTDGGPNPVGGRSDVQIPYFGPVGSHPLPKNLSVGDSLIVSYKEAGVAQSIVVKIVKVQYSTTGFDIDKGYDSDSSSMEGPAGTLVTIDDAIPETATVDGSAGNEITVSLVTIQSGVEFTKKNIAALEHNPDSADPGYQWVELDKKTVIDGKSVYGVQVNQLNAEIGGYFTTGQEFCEVLFADLYVTYRELVTSYSDTFHNLVGASEVANMLGTVDPANPLAMGVYMAALNAATDDGDQSPPIYFMATPTDDVDGYAAVLNRATLTDRAYVFAPTTQNETVLEMVRAHVLEMSTKTVKMWRIAAASAEIPEEVARLSAADNYGKDYLAIPVSDQGTTPSATAVFDKLRVVKSDLDPTGNTDCAFRSTLVVGDIVRFGYHNSPWAEDGQVYDEYVVEKIINNYTVQIKLKNGKGIDTEYLDQLAGNYEPSKIEIYHIYTSKQRAEVVASVSKALATRRMVNVFPTVFKNDGVMMTGEFAACAVAGLISSTEPQQPITNVTIRGIDDIPMVYQTYNNAELDMIASGGTFIIMQDLPNDRVYVRHQITTAYPDGNLNTAELSITKNVDSISYAFAEVFRPYYGKYNITPDLIAGFRNLASQLIDQFAGSTSVYGPQLIATETEIQYVRQNELMKDHVDIGIRLGVPYPCNNIDIVLTV